MEVEFLSMFAYSKCQIHISCLIVDISKLSFNKKTFYLLGPVFILYAPKVWPTISETSCICVLYSSVSNNYAGITLRHYIHILPASQLKHDTIYRLDSCNVVINSVLPTPRSWMKSGRPSGRRR